MPGVPQLLPLGYGLYPYGAVPGVPASGPMHAAGQAGHNPAVQNGQGGAGHPGQVHVFPGAVYAGQAFPQGFPQAAFPPGAVHAVQAFPQAAFPQGFPGAMHFGGGGLPGFPAGVAVRVQQGPPQQGVQPGDTRFFLFWRGCLFWRECLFCLGGIISMEIQFGFGGLPLRCEVLSYMPIA